MFATVISTLLLLAATNQGAPEIGSSAPDFTFRRLIDGTLQAPSKLSDLRGKTVVIEFWATWCVPCLQSMPHLERLAQELSGRPIEFVALTDEEVGVLNPFLQEHPLRLPIAVDAGRAAGRAYGVHGIPHTVVVGADGKILAVTNPTALTAKSLEDAIAGKAPDVPVKKDRLARFEEDPPDDEPPLVRTLIQPSSVTMGESRASKTRFRADGVSMTVPLPYAYEVSWRRIDAQLPSSELNARYRFDFQVDAKHAERLAPTMRTALESAFGYRVTREEREVQVLVLRVRPGTSLGLQESPPGTENSTILMHNRFRGKGGTVAAVAEFLESLVDSIVIDETGAKGIYNWDVSFVSGSRKSLLEALGKVNLELVSERRKMEFVVLSKPA